MDDVSHMAAFVATADELHLGRAAAGLGVHARTVSSRLGALEDRVGMVLVDRSHRCRIAVTQAGAALLPAARQVLEAMSAFEERGAEVRCGDRGVVRVAVTAEVDAGTAAVLRELREVDAAWDIEVECMSVREAGRAMGVGAIECSIGCGKLAPRTTPGGFDPRPNRLERARVARIAPGAVSAGLGGDRSSPRAGSAGLAISWRRNWELECGDDRGPSSGSPPPPASSTSPVSPTSSTSPGAPTSSPASPTSPGSPTSSPASPTSPGAPTSSPTSAASLDSPTSAGSSRASRGRSGRSHAAALVALVQRWRVAGGDRRALRGASRRRAVEVRAQAVAAGRRVIAEETARFGAAVAMARARARDRAEVRRRVAEARARGEAISVQLAISWLCAQDQDDGDGRTPDPP